MFRRRVRDPSADQVRAAFSAVAIRIEAAQRALLAAVPTARDEGVALGLALAGFRTELSAAQSGMDGWREGRTEMLWPSCSAAIEAAFAEAERLRLSDAQLTFEALNERIGDVLHHLDAFVEAERSIRRL